MITKIFRIYQDSTGKLVQETIPKVDSDHFPDVREHFKNASKEEIDLFIRNNT